MSKPKVRKEKNLLGVGHKEEVEDEEELEAEEDNVIASYWYPVRLDQCHSGREC